jgi:hypothetical protein
MRRKVGVEEVARIVAQIRARWPTTSIVFRADSGFCRDDLSWCEANESVTARRQPATGRQDRTRAEEGTIKSKRTGQPAREFADFRYRTRKSWRCERRIVARAEWTGGEAIRASSSPTYPHPMAARFLYEDVYCKVSAALATRSVVLADR